MTTDRIEQEVLSGESWNRFCEQLRRSGEQILRGNDHFADFRPLHCAGRRA